MMEIQRAGSARKPSQNVLANPSNFPCATRTRNMRIKNKMSVHLYIQQKKSLQVTKTMKVVRTNVKMTGSTTMKTPFSTMPKKTRNNPHRCMKANRCRRNCQRVQKTKMKIRTEPVSSKSMATAEVKIIPTPEEGPRSG